MSKKSTADAPTKASVLAMLSNILSEQLNLTWHQLSGIEDELEALDKRLLDVPERRKLKAKVDAAREKYSRDENRLRIKVVKLRRLVQTAGITPAVCSQVAALVAEANGALGED